jgi:hypothetical protein
MILNIIMFEICGQKYSVKKNNFFAIFQWIPISMAVSQKMQYLENNN